MVPDGQQLMDDSESLAMGQLDGTGYIPPGPIDEVPPEDSSSGSGTDGPVCSGVDVMSERLAITWEPPVDDRTIVAVVENKSSEPVRVTPRFRIATPAKTVAAPFAGFELYPGETRRLDLQLPASGVPVQALAFSGQVILELDKQVSGVDEDSVFSKSLYFHWNDDDSLVTYDAEERRTNYEGGDFRGTALSDAQRQRIARSDRAFGGILPTRVRPAMKGGAQ